MPGTSWAKPGQARQLNLERSTVRAPASKVAPYKKVRAVEFVDEIPKSPTGKILRRILVEQERAAATG